MLGITSLIFVHNGLHAGITSSFKKAGDSIKHAGEKAFDTVKSGVEDAVMSISVGADKLTQSSKNILFGEAKPQFCDPIAGITYAPTVDSPEVIAQDTENRIELIKKYSPIVYLCNERYFPIAAEDYFLAPETQLVYQKDHKKNPSGPKTVVIPKGQVTMEKIYEKSKQYQGVSPNDYFFEIGKCTEFGSNPKRFTDKNGNLNVPVYVTWTEKGNKIYIVYVFFYGFNGAYPIKVPVVDLPLLKGDIAAIQGAHECDKEHITLEIDKTTRKLERICFAAHRSREAIWMPANHKDIEYEGTHPIVHAAVNGHGSYPRAGTHVRIFGFGNDITCKRHKWVPQLVFIYPPDDPRANPKTMGWAYHTGNYGPRGVGPMKVFFRPSDAEEPGQPYSKSYFCPNPKSSNNPKEWLKYQKCLTEKRIKATVP